MTIREDMKEYSNNGYPKIYLAGPFFNEEQEERIEAIEQLLEKNHCDVFSPRQASKITKGCSQQDMIDTFNGNITHIDEADLVLAILDGNDTGTMFEVGYAYANKIPTLYFNETRPKDKGPNLMLALSTDLPYLMDTELNTARVYLDLLLEDLVSKGLEEVKEIYNGKPVFDEVE